MARPARDPSRWSSDGQLGAFIAQLHGRPWIPWQHHAADLIGERDHTGRYRHRIFLLGEPRQTGKTTMVHDLIIGRMLVERDYRAKYAAQTGHVTTERMTERLEELETGPLAARLKLRRSGGTERITDRRTRSFLAAFPPKDGALRSNALDCVVVDEGQEHGAVLGSALDATILPTFTTRPRRQLIIVYSAGTDASSYVRRHRAAALAGAPGYGIYEHGAVETDVFEEPATWARVHPGVGWTTDVDFLATMLAADSASFAREYLNVWSKHAQTVIDPGAWAAACKDPAAMPAGRLALAVDVGLDEAGERTSVAIALAGPLGRVELVEHEDLGAWAVPRIIALARAHKTPVAVDRHGPAGTIADELALTDGVELLTPTSADLANSTAAWLDDLAAGRLKIWPHPGLDAAAEAAQLRPLGDAGVAWSRRRSTGDVGPLVAASLARWAWARLPAPAPRPSLATG